MIGYGLLKFITLLAKRGVQEIVEIKMFSSSLIVMFINLAISQISCMRFCGVVLSGLETSQLLNNFVVNLAVK